MNFKCNVAGKTFSQYVYNNEIDRPVCPHCGKIYSDGDFYFEHENLEKKNDKN